MFTRGLPAVLSDMCSSCGWRAAVRSRLTANVGASVATRRPVGPAARMLLAFLTRPPLSSPAFSCGTSPRPGRRLYLAAAPPAPTKTNGVSQTATQLLNTNWREPIWRKLSLLTYSAFQVLSETRYITTDIYS